MNALLVGYYGARNLGDDMMLACLCHWLARQGVTITVLSEKPDQVRASGLPAAQNVALLGEWGWVEAYLRGKAVALFRTLAAHDALIVGGGELLRGDRGWKSFVFVAEKIFLALALGKPVSIVNVGFPGFRPGWRRWLLGFCLRRARRVLVRDRDSLALCRELGAAQAEHAPDIVFALPRWQPGWSSGARPEETDVVVCVRATANVFGRYDLSDARLARLADGLDHLVDRRGARVVFLPFQSAPAEDDTVIHRRIAAAMRHQDRVRILPWSGDLQATVQWIGGARMVLAMRLHAAVLAVSLGRRCVLMPYDTKVLRFASEHGLPFLLPAEMLDDTAQARQLLQRCWDAAPPPPAQAGSVWDTLRL